MRRLALGVCAVSICALSAWGSVPASAVAQTPGLPPFPIPPDPGQGNVVPFEGDAASANPVFGVPPPPRHPFMAPNPRNNIHDDPYMTDTYAISGPLGDGNEISSMFDRECASITFDSQGRIVTICVGLDRPVLALLDPHTLQVLAAMQLPVRSAQSVSGGAFNDFSGGGYFFLDHRDRAVLPTNDHHVLEVAITDAPGFAVTRDYDLTKEIDASDGIISVLPDWQGRFWFVTRAGEVGTIDRSSGRVRTLRLQGEGISNSFAVDETGGVFIVSDKALYRFDAGEQGEPSVSWRVVYPNSGVHKPGQSDAGSGTTPTLMGKSRVAITNNADPMEVVVYRRAKQLPSARKRKRKRHRHAVESRKHRKKRKRGRQAKARLVCSQPVFRKGGGSTDQSLIGTDRSLVVENNYGYSGVMATMNGGVTEPGLSRVDVVKVKPKRKHRKKRGSGHRRKRRKRSTSWSCQTVWTSDERAPSVVPKLSLASGLVYTYTKPPRSDDIDAWYLTALDFRTGRTVYRRLAGTGFGYNNNFAPVTIGPDGVAYVGVLGGLVELP
jgi:hypothetical protein